MKNKDFTILLICIIVIALFVFGIVKMAKGYEVEIIEPEITKEIRISENLQEDFNKTVQEMYKKIQKTGCQSIKGLAYTTADKPGILVITVRCVDG